ncbi:MAG: DUF4974 domain-containing protein [Bacteroides sp.]|nr:DUF4974 domain-containing protein [Bacteroides sp.]
MENYIQKIISLFTASEHSEEATRKVHRWLLKDAHADEKEAALRALWDETRGQADAETWTSLSEVYEKIGVSNNKMPKRRLFSLKQWRNMAAAAAVLVAVSTAGTYFLTKNAYQDTNMVECFTAAGNMQQLTLPDGTKVQTNSGTMLLYPEEFKGSTRTVYLIGEANFKVHKDPSKPFIVKSTAVDITALGTEFNVTAYPESNDIIATLIQGKIKVNCGETDSYILSPGQQVTYLKNSGKSLLSDANLADVTAWQKGGSIFRGKTLSEIFTALERRYNVTFQYNMNLLSNDKYNFSFRQNSDIHEIMNIMKEVVNGFDYSIKDNVCYIKFRK